MNPLEGEVRNDSPTLFLENVFNDFISLELPRITYFPML